MSDYEDAYDDDFEDEPLPPKTTREILRDHYRRHGRYLPYAPLAVGLVKGSTPWLLTAVFTLLAVKPSQKYVSIYNSSFMSSGKAPGLTVT